MKKRLKSRLEGRTQKARWQTDQVLAHSCAGRVVNTLRYFVILLSLAGWITAFLLLKDSLVNGSLSGTVLTNLTCLTFFGGLVMALLLGALVGNFIQRYFWSLLTRRNR